MLIGYKRDDKGDRQLDALRKEGCERVLDDLDECLRLLAPGDTLVVTNLHRIDIRRSGIYDFLEKVIVEKKASIRSIADDLDTSGPVREILAALLVAISKNDKILKVERMGRGAATLSKLGNREGRKPTMTKSRMLHISSIVAYGGMNVSDAIKLAGVSKTTYYRWRKRLTSGKK